MESPLSVLRSNEELAGWLDGLAAFATGAEVTLPAGDELVSVLLDLSMPHEDVNDLVATRDVLLADPHLREVFERNARTLVAGIGTIGDRREFPPLPDELLAVGRWFQVFSFIAALPYVRAYHPRLGIPVDVSRRTLADLG